MPTKKDLEFAKTLISKKIISKIEVQRYLDEVDRLLKNKTVISLEELLIKNGVIRKSDNAQLLGSNAQKKRVTHCDRCKAMYRVAEEDVGKRFKCKHCGIMVLVPPRAETKTEEKPTTTQKPQMINVSAGTEMLRKRVSNTSLPKQTVYTDDIEFIKNFNLARLRPLKFDESHSELPNIPEVEELLKTKKSPVAWEELEDIDEDIDIDLDLLEKQAREKEILDDQEENDISEEDRLSSFDEFGIKNQAITTPEKETFPTDEDELDTFLEDNEQSTFETDENALNTFAKDNDVSTSEEDIFQEALDFIDDGLQPMEGSVISTEISIDDQQFEVDHYALSFADDNAFIKQDTFIKQDSSPVPLNDAPIIEENQGCLFIEGDGFDPATAPEVEVRAFTKSTLASLPKKSHVVSDRDNLLKEYGDSTILEDNLVTAPLYSSEEFSNAISAEKFSEFDEMSRYGRQPIKGESTLVLDMDDNEEENIADMDDVARFMQLGIDLSEHNETEEQTPETTTSQPQTTTSTSATSDMTLMLDLDDDEEDEEEQIQQNKIVQNIPQQVIPEDKPMPTPTTIPPTPAPVQTPTSSSTDDMTLMLDLDDDEEDEEEQIQQNKIVQNISQQVIPEDKPMPTPTTVASTPTPVQVPASSSTNDMTLVLGIDDDEEDEEDNLPPTSYQQQLQPAQTTTSASPSIPQPITPSVQPAQTTTPAQESTIMLDLDDDDDEIEPITIESKSFQFENFQNLEISKSIGKNKFITMYDATWNNRNYIAKIMERDLAHEANQELILQDFQNATQLQHPNIHISYAIGHYQRKICYLSEFISNMYEFKQVWPMLKQDKRLTPQIILQILDAVAYAHDKNVLHGNISLEILYLKGQTPILSDFGLVRIYNQLHLMSKEQGRFVPIYFSPEYVYFIINKLEKKPNLSKIPITVQSDIYSLGIILYWIHTGKYPFRLTLPLHEIIQCIINEEPPRPDEVDTTISKPVSDLIMKCICKVPEERFQSVREIQQLYRSFCNV
jgi:DNA-directed RNA polymerase subunit RPC12/RpoP